MKPLSPAMWDALQQAQAYGDWFSVQSAIDAPVRAKHQTIKALCRRHYLERLERQKYNAMGQQCGVDVLYKIKPPDPNAYGPSVEWNGFEYKMTDDQLKNLTDSLCSD